MFRFLSSLIKGDDNSATQQPSSSSSFDTAINKNHHDIYGHQSTEGVPEPEAPRILVKLNPSSPPLGELPEEIIHSILDYLPQNDLLNLSVTNKKLHSLCQDKLVRKITIKQFANLKSSKAWLESNATTVGGSGNIFQIGKQQNDESLAYKLQRLHKHILHRPEFIENKVELLVVYDHLFNDEELDAAHFELLYDIIFRIVTANMSNLRVLKVFDIKLRKTLNAQVLSNSRLRFEKLQNVILDDIRSINNIQAVPNLEKLVLNIEDDSLVSYDLENDFSQHFCLVLSQINELTIIDDEDSSLRILKLFLDVLTKKAIHKKLQLKALRFNHYHGMNSYNHVSRNFSIVVLEQILDLSKLESVELIVNCDEPNCDCLSSFLNSLAAQLTSLQTVSIVEKLYNHQNSVKKHQIYEDWDLKAFSFLNNLPNKTLLKHLYIKTDPPVDGKIEDGLEGNYLRRRKLYETTLPQFTNLESLVLPNILSSICCYEQVVSDFLWNGCECKYCEQYLSIFDTYLMTHQYFDYTDFDFKDMISPRLFGFFSDALSKRIPFVDNKLDSNEFEKKVVFKNVTSGLNQFEVAQSIRKTAPNLVSWDFHGYSKIVCRDFRNDNDDDFYTEEFSKHIKDSDLEGAGTHCDYNQSCFNILASCADHFFKRNYLEWLAEHVPSVRFVVLNGLYYSFDMDIHGKVKINCIYD